MRAFRKSRVHIVSVTSRHQASSGVHFGPIATSVALFAFLIMLVFPGDRWSGRFPSLPDFSAYHQVSDMKAAFIAYLTPIVEYHNEKILSERKRLTAIHNSMAMGKTPSYPDLKWIERLADRYDVAWNEGRTVATTGELLTRVDIVPVQLAVVQAAKESSWGRSRYAVEVNNMFGEWCYKKGCGIVPRERTAGARHEVRRFRSVSESTRSYMHNLNSHRNYANLRALRQRLRAEGRAIEGGALVDGLLLYSERRQKYVDEIRSMIKQYSYFLRQQARSARVIKGA